MGEETIKIKEREFGADLVRVVAMLMVVVLHTWLSFTTRIDFFPSKLWFGLEPVVGLSKIAVLLFFVLSGYLVINKPKSIGENIIKTWKRIGLPLLVFSLINLVYAAYRYDFVNQTLLSFVEFEVQRIFSFPSSPLWFLVVLVWLYLLNPLWSVVFCEKKFQGLAQYLGLGALGFYMIFSVVKTFLPLPGVGINNFTAWLLYVFFYLYGGLYKAGLIRRWSKKTALVVVLVTTGLIAIADAVNMSYQVRGESLFPNDNNGYYLNVFTLVAAVAMFNFLIKVKVMKKGLAWISKLVEWLSANAFGIYLIHPFVVAVFSNHLGFHFDNLRMNVYVYNLLNFGLVLGISWVITLGVRRVPGLKKIVGE